MGVLNKGPQQSVDSTFSGTGITIIAYPGASFLKAVTAKNNQTVSAATTSYSSTVSALSTSTYNVPTLLNNSQQGIQNPASGSYPNVIDGQPLTFDTPSFAGTGLNTPSTVAALKQAASQTSGALSNARTALEKYFFPIASSSTLSYSTFREKVAVRRLGEEFAQFYTKGPRTIAGTMIFTVFNQFEFDSFISVMNSALQTTYSAAGLNVPQIVLLDQIPPFNLMVVLTNEYGAINVMNLFDVEFNSEGQQHSIHEMSIDKTVNFYAKDMLPLTPVSTGVTTYSDMFKVLLDKNQANPYFFQYVTSNSSITGKAGTKTFLDVVTQNSGTSTNDEVQGLLQASRSIQI